MPRRSCRRSSLRSRHGAPHGRRLPQRRTTNIVTGGLARPPAYSSTSWSSLMAVGGRRVWRRLRGRYLRSPDEGPDPVRLGRAIALSVHFMKQEKIEKFEYPILVLLATVGMMMMVSANDLIALYMGLELQSLWRSMSSPPSIATMRAPPKRASNISSSARSRPACCSTALADLWLYRQRPGFPGIAAAVQKGGARLGLIFGLVFVIAGLAFKVSAVPFHMWTPDVYEGSPTPVTAFFSAAPKVAAMALLVRTCSRRSRRSPPTGSRSSSRYRSPPWRSAPSPRSARPTSSGCSPIPRSAIWATRLSGSRRAAKRACAASSSIMLIYMIMTLGSFACVIAMARKGRQVEEISDLAGLARTSRCWRSSLPC